MVEKESLLYFIIEHAANKMFPEKDLKKMEDSFKKKQKKKK